jgi:dolichol-phosphate mannosyltransferase
MSSQSVSIIVPTRNEVENISPLVSQLVAQGIPFLEILFVDDDSTDGTRESIQSLSRTHAIRLVEQKRDEPGLAAAIMSGAVAAEGDLLVVMDADLSHPPDRIKDLLAPVQAEMADMVIGSRYIKGGSIPSWPLWRRIVSRAGSALAYPLTKQQDSMSGFFAIARLRLLEINPPTVGFKIAFETILRGGADLRVSEIPIAFRDRVRGQSKMSFGVALRFFYRWLLAVFRRALSPNPKARPAKSDDRND